MERFRIMNVYGHVCRRATLRAVYVPFIFGCVVSVLIILYTPKILIRKAGSSRLGVSTAGISVTTPCVLSSNLDY